MRGIPVPAVVPGCGSALIPLWLCSVKSTGDQSRAVRTRLLKAMRAVERDGSAKAVHLLRTSCRRLDVIVANVTNGQRKLRDQLRSLRRAAGKVRDLDVQLQALATVRLPSVADEQRRVTRRLERKRSRKEEKLREAVSAQRPRISRQIKRFVASGGHPSGSAASTARVREALDQFWRASEEYKNQDDARQLHDFRIACKKARYLAELAEPRQARPVIEQLKRIQDAIGEWLDWELLIATSAKALKNPTRSPLIAALRAQARSRMLHAQRVREEATQRLLQIRESSTKVPKVSSRKPPARAGAASQSAATAS
jgi:CHAD domain-containing protein